MRRAARGSREDQDAVFRALADRGRRKLLDRLYHRGGQTLNELCRDMTMTRQAVSKHLAVLRRANLVSWERAGRERRHYLNPVPIHEIAARWMHKFELPRLGVLAVLKRTLGDDNRG